MGDAPLPYGPSYHKVCERILVTRRASTYAMAAFYFIASRADWRTGIMPNQLSHKVLGETINASHNTIYKAIRQLREAGILGYHERGNNYDGGDANIYCFTLPPPTQEMGAPPHRRRAAPPPTKGRLNPYPSLSRGERASPNGSTVGHGGAMPLGDEEQTQELMQFSKDVDAHGYGRARELQNDRADQREALRAAENTGGGKNLSEAPRQVTL